LGYAVFGHDSDADPPDRVSVIKLFERNIVFQYPVSLATQEGALVPVVYLNADQDLYPDDRVILPNESAQGRIQRQKIFSATLS